MNRASSRKNYSAKPDADASIELTVPEELAGLRLDQVLAKLLPKHSRNRLAHWVSERRVTLDGAAAVPRRKVWGGERILVVPVPLPAALAPEAEPLPLEIVHEDDALLVVSKPAGLVVHPGSGNWHGTLLNALLAHDPRLAQLPRAGIVHRLDKDTSGLLVIAKILEAHTDLVRQLQARSVKRIYLAVVQGIPGPSGRIEAPIGRHPTRRTRMAVVARGKHAVTHYEIVAAFSRAALLRCRLESGRTHQIRVHLASIGHPIVGDPVYGGRRARTGVDFNRQALHAECLELTHPVTHQRLAWHAPLPADMQQLVDKLKAAA